MLLLFKMNLNVLNRQIKNESARAELPISNDSERPRATNYFARSIVMSASVSVCVYLSVCPTGYLRNSRCDLYQFFVHIFYVRGWVLFRHADYTAPSPIGGKGVTGAHSASEV